MFLREGRFREGFKKLGSGIIPVQVLWEAGSGRRTAQEEAIVDGSRAKRANKKSNQLSCCVAVIVKWIPWAMRSP